MKKIQLTLGIAAFAFGAFAFTPNAAVVVSSKSSKQTSYYWFTPTGVPLGFKTFAAQQMSCGLPSTTVCANGYASISNTGQHQGPIIAVATKI